MRITKIGHCCLILEEGDLKILTDPGAFTTEQEDVTEVDVVLITHEHFDHYHVPSLKKVLSNNPNAIVVTNKAVGELLDKEGIAYTKVGDGGSTTVKGVLIEGFGEKHGEVYGGLPTVENTGYFVANKFYFPGDSLHDPKRPVDVLALPVAGPWLKMSEVIEYAKTVHPRVAFPVHDGWKPQEVWWKFPAEVLPTFGIEFITLKDGESQDF
jgi:L-ascorbate metabolism protein UlaG (beta-lactamase superfamily)